MKPGLYDSIPEARFWARVVKSPDCWLWTGSITTAGYGNVRLPGGRFDYAHRISYRLAHGRIPDGLVIDHLCRVRACVNPNHLEAVTHAENVRRGLVPYGLRTTCKRGHDITDPANVYTEPGGNRRCRACAAEREQSRRNPWPSHCPQGHDYTPENTYRTTKGSRQCKTCNRERARNRRAA